MLQKDIKWPINLPKDVQFHSEEENHRLSYIKIHFLAYQIGNNKQLDSACRSCLDMSAGNSGGSKASVHFYSERDFAILSKLCMYLPVDTEISLLEIHPEETLPKVIKYIRTGTHCIIVCNWKMLKAA